MSQAGVEKEARRLDQGQAETEGGWWLRSAEELGSGEWRRESTAAERVDERGEEVPDAQNWW